MDEKPWYKKISIDKWADLVLSLVLVIVTAMYTCLTYSMLSITREDFVSSNRPYIYIDEVTNEIAKCKNQGKTPGLITSITASSSGKKENIFPGFNPGTKAVIAPGQSQPLSYGRRGIRKNDIVELEIKYQSLSNKKITYITKYVLQREDDNSPLMILVDSYMD